MNTPTGNIIPIRTVEDLIQLDERQLDACLKDLKTWVVFRKDFAAKVDLAKNLMRQAGIPETEIEQAVEVQDHMAWVDDGVDGGKVELQVFDENRNILGTGQFGVDGNGKVIA